MQKDELILGGDAEATTDLESEIADLLDMEASEEFASEESTPDPNVEGDEGEGEGEVTPTTEEPEGESPIEGSESEGDVVAKVDPVVPEVDEVSQLKAQIESLTTLVSQLSEKKEEVKKEDPVLNLDDLMASMDFDVIMEDKEAFVEFFKNALNTVFTSATSTVQTIVPDAVSRQVSMAEVRENFYSSNPDLNPVRPYVANVASTVAAENPEWGVEEVLKEAANRARTALNISSPPSEGRGKVKDRGPAPTLPGAKAVRTAAPQKTKLQEEIDDLLDD